MAGRPLPSSSEPTNDIARQKRETVQTYAVLDTLDSLIADDFLEFGSSGRICSKADVLNGLDPIGEFSLSDIHVTELGTGYALITYQLALINDGNRTTSLRSSIWRLENQGWRMLFHQGTPA